ncbi:MAG: TIGR03960 family B12-binding radical SAM protein, partial [Clostridia bacterium]
LADYRKMKGNVTKKEFLQYVNDTYECIYVPSLYSVLYDKDRLVSINTTRKTIKNKERNLNESFYPDTQLVPSFEIIHDRAVMELFRGCANGCRFCQAGFIYRPVREKCPDDVYDRCVKLLENTGYGELSLNSLSTGDYSGLMPLLNKLNPYAKEHNIALNLPSLRLDSFEGEYADGNRKSSLTFAPEAGTQRLRDVINKNISEEDILGSLSKAFAEGYSSVKLYFMIGLPTETMEDIEGIVELAIKIRSLYFTVCTAKKDLRISISASTFIPKPFTPFQWAKFATREEIKEKQEYLVTKLKTRHITFSYHDYETSELEAILARGGRSLAPVLLRAYQLGAKFDAWSEHFHYEYYKQAFAEFNTNIDYIVGEKTYEQALPWDITDIGVTKEYLASENEKSKKAISTPSCTKQCNNCGLASYGWCKNTHGNKAR